MDNLSKAGRFRILAALAVTVVLSVILWREFRLRNPNAYNTDTVRYLHHGMSLWNDRLPFPLPESYEDFSNGVEARRLGSYPNQAYALIIAGLCRGFSALEGRFVLWPLWIPNVAATAIGFCFLYLLFRRFLPERDVWLGMGLLGFQVSLMTGLTLPLTDGVGWCFAMGLLWLAVCRPVSPWTLGVGLGVGALFRLQLLVLLPFVIGLRQPQGTFREYVIGFLKMAAALAGVMALFEAGMTRYVRIPPGVVVDNPYGGVTWYMKDFLQFQTTFGSLGGAAANFVRSLADLFYLVPVHSIGLALPLSLVVWMARADTGLEKQARLLWAAAVAWSLLPLLLYASENNPVPAARYQIVSIPLYVLTALYGLARLPRFPGKPVVLVGVKGLLAALMVAGCVVFNQEANGGKERHFGRIREIYEDFETMPRLVTEWGMASNGVYLVRPTMQPFLPDSRMIFLPTRHAFDMGARNHELDGIIFLAKALANNPGWKKAGPIVTDQQGVRFVRVYTARGQGGLTVYKREETE